MRWKTESGKVVSSHSSACGASSFVAKPRIDSRSCSCSSVKMKCLRRAPKSGLRTSLRSGGHARTLPGPGAEVNSGTSYFSRTDAGGRG